MEESSSMTESTTFCLETSIRSTVVKTPPINQAMAETTTNVAESENNESQNSCRESPRPMCAICLSSCTNMCYTNSCLHQFCYECLSRWSEVRAVCPLCKQAFKSIIHNIRSNSEYDEFMVGESQAQNNMLEMRLPSLVNYTETSRYRTSSTFHRSALQNYLLRRPLGHSLYSGVLNYNMLRHGNYVGNEDFRASIYRFNLWSKPLPDITGRFRDCSPNFYRMNPSTTVRLVPWLNRELSILLNPNLQRLISSNYVVDIIMDALPRYHILSRHFYNIMHSFCDDNTEHFQHEFYEFARSPFDIIGYDRVVEHVRHAIILQSQQYVISSNTESEDDSDVRIVSPDNNYSGIRNNVRRPSYNDNDDSVVFVNEEPGSSSIISTAGSSYGQHSRSLECLGPIEIMSHSSSGSDSDACVVVGILKPPEQRTPELITLNSDSDSDVVINEAQLMPVSVKPIEISTTIITILDKRQADKSSSYSSCAETKQDKPDKSRKCTKKRYRKKMRSLTETPDSSDSDISPCNFKSRDGIFIAETSSTNGYYNQAGPSESRTNKHSKSKFANRSVLANRKKGKSLKHTDTKNKRKRCITTSSSNSNDSSYDNTDVTKTKKLKSVVIKTKPLDTKTSPLNTHNNPVFSDNGHENEYSVGPPYYNCLLPSPKLINVENSVPDLTTTNMCNTF